LAADCRL